MYRILSKTGESVQRNSIKDPELYEKLSDQVRLFTEKKSIEIDALKENEKFRREFIGNVSHELKTPLFSIQGFIDILLSEKENNRDTELKYLQKISNNTDRLIDIVNDLTLISQAESNKLMLNYGKFNLYDLFIEVKESVFELAKHKKIKIKIDFLHNINASGDRSKLFQVIFNLVENAIFYCPEKSEILVQVLDIEDKWMVEILDNGPGIEADKLHRIFDRFYRVDEYRSKKLNGTGLGLSIVKNILLAHNQTIQVESELGKGTKFSFSLEK